MIATSVIASGGLIVRGRVSDALTNEGVPHARLTLEMRQAGVWSDIPFAIRQKAGGWFGVGASMPEIAARLRLGVGTKLRLNAVAQGYDDAKVDLNVNWRNFSRFTQHEAVGGVDFEYEIIKGAPFDLSLSLLRKPVKLAGMVLRDFDPNTPAAGVRVTLSGGATVTTDPAGRFQFNTPPVAQSLNVSARDGPVSASIIHVVDFGQPVNTTLLSLTTRNP